MADILPHISYGSSNPYARLFKLRGRVHHAGKDEEARDTDRVALRGVLSFPNFLQIYHVSGQMHIPCTLRRRVVVVSTVQSRRIPSLHPLLHLLGVVF